MTIIRYVIIDENTTPHASFRARAVCCSLSPLASLFLPVVSHLWHVSPFSLSLSLSSDWISLPRFFTSVMYTPIYREILQTQLGSVYIYYTRWPLSAFDCIMHGVLVSLLLCVYSTDDSVTLESLLRLSARKCRFWFAHVVGEETLLLFYFTSFAH